MSAPQTQQLTRDSLALISRALTQLEVGQLALLSFGERVRILHQFTSTFTPDSGSEILQRLTFNQQRTSVLELMRESLDLLIAQRAHFQQQQQQRDLWQLQIILSDGLCEDHEAIRRLVRKAAEHRILVVFIMLQQQSNADQQQQAVSILNTKQVKFVDGKMVVQEYMDTFPFDFYVVLRDIRGLPEVLSNALRQWFEIIKE